MARGTAAALLLAANAATAVVDVGRFASASGVPPPPWRIVRFDTSIPATSYRTIHWDGVEAVAARADGSMALLARPVEVELQATPQLCWRWRVEGVVQGADMRTKRGDDYAARIYVAFRLPADSLSFALRARLAIARLAYGPDVPDGAINYVWDNRHAIGTRMPNAYTERTQMVVLRSGESEARHWATERRNVRDDALAAFGTDRARVQLIGLAADTDNTGERVTSGFADLHFVAAGADCEFR